MQTMRLDLQREVKKTIVFITHDLDEAMRLGNRVALLRDGEVIQQGNAQEILSGLAAKRQFSCRSPHRRVVIAIVNVSQSVQAWPP